MRRRPEIEANVPMGYTPGLPVLNIINDNLCVEVPFLRYKVTGEKDRTLVYPVRYVATYLVPELTLVRFVDLAFTPEGEGTDFNRPVGMFRHAAIANLSRGEYDALRVSVLEDLGLLAAAMLGEAEMEADAHKRLRDNMSRLVEPSIIPFYRSVSPDFSDKYIINGQDSQGVR